jgi:hypothetical protein
MITLRTLARISAMSARASRIAGIAITPSMTRIMTVSSRRWKPITRPIAAPRARLSRETAAPTASETRAP